MSGSNAAGVATAAPDVVIYTDGACKGNPGVGGWGALLRAGAREKELFGGEAHTTNNRMELLAVIRALEALTRPSAVELFTDSQYVKNGIETWIHGWRRKGWKNAAGEPVKNRELWELLAAAAQPHTVTWEWVKGHAGHHYNERCDVLAKKEAEQWKAGARG